MPTALMEMPRICFHQKGIEGRSCDSEPILWFFAPLPKRRGRPSLMNLEESQVESSEHQDNANTHHQSFPESVSEER
jgi:hypothetical protein